MKYIIISTVLTLLPAVAFISYTFGRRVERHRALAEVLYHDWVVSDQKSGMSAKNKAVILEAYIIEINETPVWLKALGRPRFHLGMNDLDSMSEEIYRQFQIANSESRFSILKSPQGIAEVLRPSFFPPKQVESGLN